MKYCNNCLMPDTRPHIIFDEDGICQACKNYEIQKTVDWNSRLDELRALCDKYRRTDGYYDCLIAVSGQKDSTYLTHMMKERMNMNPLLVCVTDPCSHTEAGTRNLKNIIDTFNCDMFVFHLSTDLFRRVTKIGFEELGEPLRFIEAVIYTMPYKLAVSFNIPLVVWGENASYLYGTSTVDTHNVEKFIFAGHSSAAEKLSEQIKDFWLERGISEQEVNSVILPTTGEIERVKPYPIFMSYYSQWDDEYNSEFSKRYGFEDLHHEYRRENCVEDYTQMDGVAYMMHIWTKYPKFGFQRATDLVCRWIRKGKITKEEGLKLIMKYDHRMDQKMLDDFNNFLGYTPRQFWGILEKFWNREIFEKVDGIWRLKNPLLKYENPLSLYLPTWVEPKITD